MPMNVIHTLLSLYTVLNRGNFDRDGDVIERETPNLIVGQAPRSCNFIVAKDTDSASAASRRRPGPTVVDGKASDLSGGRQERRERN